MSIYIHIRIGDVLWGYHGISGYLFCISCHIIFYVCIYRYILCIYIYIMEGYFFWAFFCFWFLVFCFWFLFFGFWFLRFLVSGLYLLVYNSHIYIDRGISWTIQNAETQVLTPWCDGKPECVSNPNLGKPSRWIAVYIDVCMFVAGFMRTTCR